MKKLIYTLIISAQLGLIWQKISAPYSIHWGVVFVPLYFVALVALMVVVVLEMKDNEHPNDFDF